MIAHYTQTYMSQLRQHGTAAALFMTGDAKSLSRARSRLHNSARRAGVQVTTHVEDNGRTGYVVAVVK